MLEAVKKVFASPETYIKPELSSVLASHIVEILLGGARLSLLYSKEGIKIDGSRNATKGLLKEIEEFKTKPFICIPLNNLIEEFIEFDKTETLSREFGLFSETEESVIKALRNDDVKEIQIRKSNENEPTIIQITKREITGEKVRMIKRLLGMNDFDEMRVVLRNDKHIFIESKSKNKTH
ncbi:MAG: hypothetical protein M0D57_10635 [Sphingobacteriales bacterium JAD_PAG50586_3]|nr:MAG: hypothetical protein M0D57_10635 [Sphingobacteriales bacterium JAD_PAG50586_3]